MFITLFLFVTLLSPSIRTFAHPPPLPTRPSLNPDQPLPSRITIVGTPPILYSNNNTSEYTFYSHYICPTLTFGLGDFDRFPNGSIYIKAFKKTLERRAYVKENNNVTICKPKSNLGFSCITMIGYKIALISLIIQLILFSVRWDLEKYLSFSIATVGVLVIILNLMSLQYFLNNSRRNLKRYYTVPSLNHLFVLASISVMSMMSTEIFMNVLADIKRFINTIDRVILKVIMGLIALLLSITIVIMTFMILSYTGLHFIHTINVFTIFFHHEPDDFCWTVNKSPCLPFFIGQVFSFMLMNCSIHYFSSRIYRAIRYEDDMVEKVESIRSTHKTVFKFSIVIYITYTIGALAAIPAMSWLWFIFHYMHIFEVTFLFFWSAIIQVTEIRYRMNLV